jgi:hypothetical protein
MVVQPSTPGWVVGCKVVGALLMLGGMLSGCGGCMSSSADMTIAGALGFAAGAVIFVVGRFGQ